MTLSVAILFSLYSIIQSGTALAQSGTIISYNKISQVNENFNGKLKPGGSFGQSICLLGDLDGDGIAELAVGLTGNKRSKLESREIWILYLHEDGSIKQKSRIARLPMGKTIVHDRSEYGFSIAALGDLNGDRIPDLVVGAPEDDETGLGKGAVWILYMELDGTIKSQHKVGSANDYLKGALDSNDNFGCSVAAFKDLNGDNIPDLAVGAYRDDDGNGHNQGAVYILFLTREGAIKKYQKISQSEGNFRGKLSKSNLFGSALANIGDLNKDGTDDLAVGAYFDNESGVRTGVVWILFLASDGTVKSERKIKVDNTNYSGDASSLTFFGKSISCPGDLNQDGIQDLVIGANSIDEEFKGEIWVAFMNRDGSVKSFELINSNQGLLVGKISEGDQFGHSITGVGDLDKNGIPDIAVGAPFDDDGGSNLGAVWLLNMAKTSIFKAVLMFNTNNPAINVDVLLFNESGDEIEKAKTDRSGQFTFRNTSVGVKYKIILAQNEVSLSENASIHIHNNKGEPVKRIPINVERRFQIIPNTRSYYNQMKPIVMKDSRVLVITVKGQLYKEQPGDLPEGASVYITNQSQEVLYATQLDEQGNFKFKRQSPKEHYSIRSLVGSGNMKLLVKNKKGEVIFEAKMDRDGKIIYERFKPGEELITLKDGNDEEVTVKAGEEFNLNIYFTAGTANLNDAAVDMLDKVVLLLKRNSHIAIAIGAHTDSRGNAENNLVLSRKRAEGVVKYIYGKGIEITRIDAHGYGETKLKNKCGDGITCTEAEHKMNRRVEVIITKLGS